MNRCHTLAMAFTAAALFPACADPIEGQWEAVVGVCANDVRDGFNVDGDLSGTGDFVLACTDGTGDALACAAQLFIIERPRDDMWTLEAQFGYCPATEEDYGRRYKDCASRADGELTCCDPDGRHCVEYVRLD